MDSEKLRIATLFGLAFYLLSLLAPAMISWSGIEILAEEPDSLDESSNPALSPSHDVGNYSRGGYHLATGDWWEPPQPFNVSITDSDGDGVPDSNDSHPLDPALPPVNSARASLCISGTTSAVPVLDPSWTSSNSLYTESVAWGDVDGDGDHDLVVGNYGNNEVYLNNGTALATTPAWTSSNALNTRSVAWGDVDGDGDLDLAVGNYGGGDTNEIYLNSGTTP